MISIKINDIKNFMSKLLVGTTFDFLSTVEVSITTSNTFNINGHINKNYFTKEEFDELKDHQFISWENLKPFCYNLIKGAKTPDKMKIIFALPPSNYPSVIQGSDTTLTVNDISGLYIHLTYENDGLTAVTASSLSVFTMDKSIDKYWDSTILKFLLKHFDANEI